ncbi:MAG: hypothetical protein PHG55_07010 [Verrucomicrobiota bacterium]|nr:hypothetical protein [Verrucomicrobiota bacterium]
MRRARVFLLALFAAHSSLLANTLQWAPAPSGPWQNVSAEIETEVDGTFAYSAVAQGREGYFRLLMSDGKVADITGLKPTLTMTFRPPAVQPPTLPNNTPAYVAGTVVIPAEFTKYGPITELRFEKCSVANGLLKHVGGLVYSLPGPEHEVWRWTDSQNRNPPRCIGTRVKFANGMMFDGWVRDYATTSIYSMPILTKQTAGGNAFWIRMQ